MKNEYERLVSRGLVTEGLTKEEMLKAVSAQLEQGGSATPQHGAPQHAALQYDVGYDAERKPFITHPTKSSVYLPDLTSPAAFYKIALDSNGTPYVTDGATFSKWVSEFWPEDLCEARDM